MSITSFYHCKFPEVPMIIKYQGKMEPVNNQYLMQAVRQHGMLYIIFALIPAPNTRTAPAPAEAAAV
jgi:hypothetical protein